jgi:hypothetical protein
LAVRLQARLRWLEQQLGGGGRRLARRDRQGRAVLIEARELPDGTVVSETAESPPCAACGAVPERIIRVMLTVAESSGAPAQASAGKAP